jgi:phosphohistidine phosphatase
MRVILFRHGIAHDRADPACPPDPERQLTDEGRKKTKRAARGLVWLDAKPTRILTSTLVRAQQTAVIAAEELGIAVNTIISTEALLPETPPYALFHALHAFSDTDEEVLVCGHAPNLDLVLALALTGGRQAVTRLKKAGAAMLECDDLPRPQGELVWLMPAKVLGSLG